MAERKWWLKLYDAEGEREYGEEEERLAMAAMNGLLDGRLEPLAAFLRAGYDLPVPIRRDIVQAITGEDEPEFQLKMTKRPGLGPGTPLSKIQTALRDFRIGLFVHSHPDCGRQTEAAFAAAVAEFNVERGVVVAAWSRFKKSDWAKSLREAP
jgi:hypothetical protein